MLAYIPYMDPMGKTGLNMCDHFFFVTKNTPKTINHCVFDTALPWKKNHANHNELAHSGLVG